MNYYPNGRWVKLPNQNPPPPPTPLTNLFLNLSSISFKIGWVLLGVTGEGRRGGV